MLPPKAQNEDLIGRFREIISDPLNLLIERVPMAGVVQGNLVYLHNGIRVAVSGPGAYYGQLSSILAINRGVHEPLEEFAFQEALPMLPDSPVMLELGAYWGHYSMWFKRARPGGAAFLVEPVAEHLAAGRANFARNGIEGHFTQAAVGKGHFEVDRFISERDIASLDILHADIQGFECEMLAGAQDTLRRKLAGYVFISTHSQALHHETISMLRRHGYRVEISADFAAETTSCDGFVLASSPDRPVVFTGVAAMGRERILSSTARDRLDYLSSVLGQTR